MNGAPHVALIGSRGRMGSMLLQRMRDAGILASGADQPLADAGLDGLCATADLVLLCVPIAAMPDALHTLRPHLDKQVLADIASVKVRPVAHMEEAYAGPVVGTHPLFGPDARGGQRVAVCRGTRAGEEHLRLVEAIFARIGCEPFRTTAQAHDEAAAYIQGLNFVTSAAYFAALAEHPEFLPFLTPSFQRRREAARTMFTEDGPLFEALFEANPAGQDAVRSYRAFLNLAAGGDLSLLRERALWWWTNFKE
ncbi:MAG: prephenate dehydrogenase/arogenate dehydrogenase family protein [Deltaproteobacteria bacterium]|jgi:prephenate dehydrogenase|nr:prephenate dehydrogenase/arogenate dehydrogenase family protein [Deltaproteobacteria bacterium]